MTTVNTTFRATDRASGPAKKVADSFAGIAAAAKAAQGQGRLAFAMANKLRKHGQANVAASAKQQAEIAKQQAKAVDDAKAAAKAAMMDRAGKIGGTGGSIMSNLIGGVTLGTLAANAIMGIASAAKDAASAVLGLVASFAGGILSAGAFRERAILAFDALSKGAKTGVADLAKVRQLAFEMGINFEDTANSIMKLRKMGFTEAGSDAIFKSMQDLRAVGSTADETKRAIIAITQIKSSGRLLGDELLQLAEAGVSISEIYKQLGKIMGKTVPEVMKLKEAGKIDSDTAIKGVMAAIAEMTGSKTPGELGKKIANETIGGLLEKLKNFGGIAMDTIAEKVAPAFMKLKPILDDIMNALQSPEAKKAIDDIAAGVSAIFGATVAAWPAIKQFTAGLLEGLAPLKSMLSGFASMLGPLFKALGIDAKDAASGARLLGQALALVIGAAVMLTGLLAGVVALFAAVPAAIAGAAVAIGLTIGAIINWLVALPGRITATAGAIATAAIQLGSDIINGLVNGITAGAARVIEAVKGVAQGAISAAAMTLKISSPSKVFAEMGGFMAEGMALGIADGADGVATASSKMSLGGADGAAGMGMGGGRGPVSIQVTIPVSGAGDPKAVAAEVQRSFLANLASAFEGLQAEAGA